MTKKIKHKGAFVPVKVCCLKCRKFFFKANYYADSNTVSSHGLTKHLHPLRNTRCFAYYASRYPHVSDFPYLQSLVNPPATQRPSKKPRASETSESLSPSDFGLEGSPNGPSIQPLVTEQIQPSGSSSNPLSAVDHNMINQQTLYSLHHPPVSRKIIE